VQKGTTKGNLKSFVGQWGLGKEDLRLGDRDLEKSRIIWWFRAYIKGYGWEWQGQKFLNQRAWGGCSLTERRDHHSKHLEGKMPWFRGDS